jgi:hypothetical protein
MANTKTTSQTGQYTKSSREESLIQASCIEWFKNNYCLKHHNPRFDIFSVPNEATWNNNNFKALGVRKGVSDLIVVLNNKILFIEMKDPKGNQSEEQIDFEEVLTNLGHEYFIIRSLEQFKKLIWKKLK